MFTWLKGISVSKPICIESTIQHVHCLAKELNKEYFTTIKSFVSPQKTYVTVTH